MERIYKFSIESDSDRISCVDYGTHDQMMDLYEKTVKQFDEYYEKHNDELKQKETIDYDFECVVTEYDTNSDKIYIEFDIIPMYEDGDDFSEEIEHYLQK